MLNHNAYEGYIANEPTFVGKDSYQYCKFTLAVPRDYKDDDGNTPADFIPCIAFGANAERLAENFIKGKRITVTGRMESSKFEGEDGKPKYRFNLKVNQWYFGEKKPKVPQSIEDLDISDSDLPF
ncbi:MAG: single-stranded DNA-binding protein [Acutalibacteraceae bacterium]|nr:single-stranded DNA-binding protein [Acutalibacteraceae bacterium]